MINTIYAIASAIICIFLLAFDIRTYRADYQGNRMVVFPIGISIAAVIVYAAFIYTKNVQLATIFNTLYFVGTIWLAFAMLRFIAQFTDTLVNKRWLFIALTVGSIVDTAYMIANCFTPISFQVVPRESTSTLGHFWSIEYNFSLHIIHLGFCYIMVSMSLILLIYKIIHTARIYKQEYTLVLLVYGGVIAVNMFCYTMDTAIDMSVPLYGVLASFVCYYSIYGAPKKFVDEMLREVNSDTDDAILFFDSGNECLFANDNAKAMFTSAGEHFSNKAAELFRKHWLEENFDSRRYKRNNRIYEVEYREVREGDYFNGSYLIFRDRTEETEEYEHQRYLTTHDTLTGLYNREQFFQKTEEVIRKDQGHSRYLLASNIKNFKLINELYGREKGDEVLKGIANMISIHSLQDNVYGRIGDDKFGLLMREEAFVGGVFEDCIADVQKQLQDKNFNLQVNIGIYRIQPGEYDVPLMYDKACMAITQQETSIQKVFVFYDDSIMRQMQLDKEILNDFQESLDEGRFELMLEPVMDRNVNMLGVAAKTIWKHPSYSLMMPEVYLGVLGREGLLYRLDRYLWEEAIRSMTGWEKKSGQFMVLTVSEKDIYYLNVFDTIMHLLKKYDVDPHNIRIAIKESTMMENLEKYRELLDLFHKEGMEVIMSDFGSSYSSLNVLKDIRIEMLAFNTTMMTHFYDEEKSQIILKSIVKMAKALGIKVLAENIETEEEAEEMRTLGADLLQGSFFSELLSEME